MTVGELLDLFVTAPQAWKPATRSLHRYVVKSLATDPLCRSRLVVVTAGSVQTAIGRWQESGASIATVSGRWLVLRSALSWAVRERLFTVNPLLGIRGPARPAPRHLSLVEVRQQGGWIGHVPFHCRGGLRRRSVQRARWSGADRVLVERHR